MKHVFVDSGGFFAHLVSEDALHARARELFAQAEREDWHLVTTNAVTEPPITRAKGIEVALFQRSSFPTGPTGTTGRSPGPARTSVPAGMTEDWPAITAFRRSAIARVLSSAARNLRL